MSGARLLADACACGSWTYNRGPIVPQLPGPVEEGRTYSLVTPVCRDVVKDKINMCKRGATSGGDRASAAINKFRILGSSPPLSIYRASIGRRRPYRAVVQKPRKDLSLRWHANQHHTMVDKTIAGERRSGFGRAGVTDFHAVFALCSSRPRRSLCDDGVGNQPIKGFNDGTAAHESRADEAGPRDQLNTRVHNRVSESIGHKAQISFRGSGKVRLPLWRPVFAGGGGQGQLLFGNQLSV